LALRFVLMSLSALALSKNPQAGGRPLVAAGVNLLLPFSPAFCFDVIVCFSLEYKILGLAGGP